MSLVTCHVSHVTCHMSHVTCHMSPVTCHMSDVKKKLHFFFFSNVKIIEQSGGASRWRVCYQRGLPCLVTNVITLITLNTVNTVITIIVKYQMILLYYTKGNFFTKSPTDRQTERRKTRLFEQILVFGKPNYNIKRQNHSNLMNMLYSGKGVLWELEMLRTWAKNTELSLGNNGSVTWCKLEWFKDL